MRQIRVAFFVTHFPRLSETFVLNQITGLIDAGHEVDIFAYEESHEPKQHKDILKYQLMNRTTYYGESLRNMPVGKLKRILGGIRLYVSHFGENPRALMESVNLLKYKKDAASLRNLYTIIPFLGKRDYEIVHCHFGPNGNIGVHLRDLGIFSGKVITVFHGYDMSKYLQENGRNIYRRLFIKGDLFLPISNNWKNELITMGCNPDKIMVHHMGIETEKYFYRRNRNENREDIRILSIGRFVEKKGIEYGIEAIGNIVKKHPKIEYRIIGDGELRPKIEFLIRNMGLQETVKLLGWHTQEELIDAIKESDILLAPSVKSADGDQEGIPVVLMEAMAMGLPVVSTNHSGIPELVKDGVSGLLVPERDTNMLAKALSYLIERPEKRSDMGRNGRRIVEEEFDVKKLNQKLLSIYEAILGEKL